MGRTIAISLWMLLAALTWGCAGSLTTPDDDDASDDDGADDDAGDDDAGDDDAGDDDAGDDDSGDDDAGDDDVSDDDMGDDDSGAVSFDGTIDMVLDVWGWIQAPCQGPMTAELSGGMLVGSASCKMDFGDWGAFPVDFSLECAENNGDLQGVLIYHDTTGYLGDQEFPTTGSHDAGAGTIDGEFYGEFQGVIGSGTFALEEL